jgi:hypothetical protein
VRAGQLRDLGPGPVVAVVTGGNIDVRVLGRLIARHAGEAAAQ